VRGIANGSDAVWTERSTHARPGRPSTAAVIRTLVDKMGRRIPSGSASDPRELVKLGIALSERTVSRLLRQTPSSTITDAANLSHESRDGAGVDDFFTVPTLRVACYSCSVLLSHHPANFQLAITEHPTAGWTAQQIINAFGRHRTAMAVARPRCHLWNEFRRRVRAWATTEVILHRPSPWQNPFAERLIGSLRREFLITYHSERTTLRRVAWSIRLLLSRFSHHLSLAKDAPTPRRRTRRHRR